MRVQVEPTRVELIDGQTFTVTATVTNTTTVIGGYQIRVLGADPQWVRIPTESLSLFPGTTESVVITVTLPPGVNAGERRIAVQIRETTPPQSISITEIELVVPPRTALILALSPMTVTAGKTARYSLVAENTGNAPLSLSPIGLDPEYRIRFRFTPAVIDLLPGARVITDLRTTAKRRWFGSPVVRPFGIGAVPPADVPALLAQQEAAADAKQRAKKKQRQQEKSDRREAKRRAKAERKVAKAEHKEAQRRARAGEDESIVDALRAPSATGSGSTGTASNPHGDGQSATARHRFRTRARGRAHDEESWIDPDTGLRVHADGRIDAAPAARDDASAADAAPPEPPEAVAQGVMVQKARLGRGVLSLLSLLLAVTVFAVVITIAFSRLVGVSAADRDLAIQVASARDAGAGAGTSSLGGTVALFTDDSPAPGVTVELFDDGDLSSVVSTTATDDDGVWSIKSLSAGSYKLRFRGAGFAEVWYPNALTGEEAEAVTIDNGQSLDDLATMLGGLPATVSGVVTGEDVAGAILTVEVPLDFLQTPGAGPDDDTTGDSAADADDESEGPAADDGGILRTIPIGSDGTFELTDLPSPAVYDLVVTKPGFALDRQRIDLEAGESRSGISLHLRTGDGQISGAVSGTEGPLGGAVVTATSGDITVRTLTLTDGEDAGAFTLRGLVTPATYTITVAADGYTTTTATLSLMSQQQLDGALFSLSRSASSLFGTVHLLDGNLPAPGVTVSISTGSDEPLTTVTQSGDTAGSWEVADIPIPGTYTVTFSRSDLQSQTVVVSLDTSGNLLTGGDDEGLQVVMRSAFATVQGLVQQQAGGDTYKVGEATVTLSAGDRTYTVKTSSVPAGDLGTYVIAGIEPGTYTLTASARGTTPTTDIISVTAGQYLSYNPMLIQPASISGVVTSGGAPLPGAEVTVSLASEYTAKVYAQTQTDTQGRYSFPVVDAPQAYVIEVKRPDSGPLASETIVLDASEAGVVNLEVTETDHP